MAIKIAGTEVINDNKRVLNNESLPDVRPSLLLDFANSKTLDPRITFTRGSTATYWDGKTTAKAEENLLTYSQDFLNATYGRNGVTVTTDAATAPDGTTTANNVVPSVASNYQSIQSADISTSGDQVQSVFVKSNGYTKVALRESNAGQYYVSFDLASGGSILDSSGATGSITDVGNGWFRISASATRTGNTRWSLYLLPSTYTSGNIIVQWSGDGTSSIYAWGAQLEQRSSATAYTATTTSPIVKYQPVLQTAASGEARFDHDPVTGESKGLLIEEARTNLMTNSETFDTWSKNNTSVSANATVAPDGTLSADKVYKNNTTNQASVSRAMSAATGDLTFTFYVKSAEYDTVGFTLYNPTDSHVANGSANLTNGTVITTSGTIGIEDIGNGWWRISGSGTATASNSIMYIYPKDATSYQGNGYSGVFVWGAQVEQGSFPTSYIPTSGSTVTRAADDAYMTDLSMFAPNEFTVYVEGKHPPLHEYRRIVDVGDDSGSSNSNTVSLFGNPAGNLATSIRINGTAQGGPSTLMVSHARGDNVKAVIAVAENDAAASADGLTPTTDTTVNFAGVDFNRIWIGRGTEGYNTRYADEAISKIAIYPKRLPNATLQAMTEA